MAEPIYGLSGRDLQRVSDAVKDYETGPSRRPVAAPGGPVVAPASVLLFEVVSGPTDGVYLVKILRRKPSGGYEATSTIQVKAEDINAV